MTTTVTIDAHCDPKTKKVRVMLGKRNDGEKEEHYLEDGESGSHAVYDEIYISVDEIPK